MKKEKASDIELEPMLCPSCGEQMPHYGGSAGFIHCEFKVLTRPDGWFDGWHWNLKGEAE